MSTGEHEAAEDHGSEAISSEEPPGSPVSVGVGMVMNPPLVWHHWHASLVSLGSSADQNGKGPGRKCTDNEVLNPLLPVSRLELGHVLESLSLRPTHVLLGPEIDPGV